jgi:hypothetical protein
MLGLNCLAPLRSALVCVLFATFAAPLFPHPSSAEHLAAPHYQYQSPVPNATLVTPSNNIVFREGSLIDASTIAANRVTVTGSRTGAHLGTLTLSDDSSTLVFKPAHPFGVGETVHVELVPGLRTIDGRDLPPLSFSFSTGASDPSQHPVGPLDDLISDVPVQREAGLAPAAFSRFPTRPSQVTDSLPSTYPLSA